MTKEMNIKLIWILIIIGWISIYNHRSNILLVLLSFELIQIGIALNILNTSIEIDEITGTITTLFILCMGAAETSIGLSLLIVYNKNK